MHAELQTSGVKYAHGTELQTLGVECSHVRSYTRGVLNVCTHTELQTLGVKCAHVRRVTNIGV